MLNIHLINWWTNDLGGFWFLWSDSIFLLYHFLLQSSRKEKSKFQRQPKHMDTKKTCLHCICIHMTTSLPMPWCISLSWVFSRGHVSSFPLILMSLGTVLYIGERLHQTSFKTMCLCYRPKSTSDIKQTQIFALSCWVISICPNHKLRLRLSSPELRTLRLLSYLAQGCAVCAGPADRTHDTGPHASSTRHKGGF